MNKMEKSIPLQEVDKLRIENLAVRKELLMSQVRQLDSEMFSLVLNMRKHYKVASEYLVDISQDFKNLLVFENPKLQERTNSDGEEKEQEKDVSDA